MIRWPADRIIALSSVFVAICSMVIAGGSLYLAVTQAEVARNHDRLMVQPRLVVSFDYNTQWTGFTLINEGLGPARLRGFKVLIDGVSQQPTDFLPRAFKDLKLPPPPPGSRGITFTDLYVGEIIPSGSGAPYMKPLLTIPPGEAANALQMTEERVNFEICYCSIYNQCWLFSNRRTKRDDSCSTFSSQRHSAWWQG